MPGVNYRVGRVSMKEIYLLVCSRNERDRLETIRRINENQTKNLHRFARSTHYQENIRPERSISGNVIV